MNLEQNLEELPDWVTELRKQYGKFSGFVHCAGYNTMAPFKCYDLKDAEKMFNIHFHAGMLLARGVTDRRNAQKPCSCVFISSICTVTALRMLTIYASAKGALLGAVKCMSKELSTQGIRVNCVSPALVRTPLTENYSNVVMGYDVLGKEDEIYQEYMSQVIAIKHVNSVVSGKTYPIKMSKVYDASKENMVKKWIRDLRYMRHYSVVSLVLMFFVVSFIGWIWEVILHLIEDGRFVNRGVLHGPWLPIYGAGGILILLLLFKFRKNAVLEFITAIILCGVVEYFTSWYLEIAHNGKKWWDYTGYFLNLNGRICAEGLLVFGLGGIAFVYIVAPMLDNILRKISMAILVPLCVALIIIFMTDKIYSNDNPNEGKGITDYALNEKYLFCNQDREDITCLQLFYRQYMSC